MDKMGCGSDMHLAWKHLFILILYEIQIPNQGAAEQMGKKSISALIIIVLDCPSSLEPLMPYLQFSCLQSCISNPEEKSCTAARESPQRLPMVWILYIDLLHLEMGVMLLTMAL